MKYIFLFIISLYLVFSCKASNKTIDAAIILKQINKGEDVYYENVTIQGDLDLFKAIPLVNEGSGIYKVYIHSALVFQNCTFQSKLLAFDKSEKDKRINLVFNKSLVFTSCNFQDEVNFRDADCLAWVNFTASTFEKLFNAEGLKLHASNNYFMQCNFKSECRMQRLFVLGDFNAMNVTFQLPVSFQKSVFHSNVQLSNMKSKGSFSFSDVRVMGSFFMNYSEIEAKADFYQSQFFGRFEWIGGKSLADADFSGIKSLDNLLLKETTFSGNINFENAVFLLAKPDLTGAIYESGKLILK